MTYDPALRRRTPLAEKLIARIRRSGPITVAEYFEACLRDPEHGYYRAHADAIGRNFITAPEISQMFGELIGLWCAVAWRQMGSPAPIRLIELGPGRGTMMRDMLSAARLAPDFLAAVQVAMVETSGPLTGVQQSLLANASVPIEWHAALPDPVSSACVFVANEFLDAVTGEQYVRTETGWSERTVGIDAHDRLQFMVGRRVADCIAAQLSDRFPAAGSDEVVEVRDYAVLDWLAAQAEAHALAALLIDYGHMHSTTGDTLQAVRRHHQEHPLCSPGEADLTMHVDFGEVVRRVQASPSLACDGPVTQAEFLGALGLVERASRLMAANPARALEIETAAQRLLAPGGMGTRFKAVGVRSRRLPPLPGFTPAHAPA